MGCSPWGREESDMTELLPFHFSLSCIGEGNGNPLQCSCLENPGDGAAWWDAVYGVTRLGHDLATKPPPSLEKQNKNLRGVTAAAKSLQSCLTLCDPRDGSPPGSPVPGILQAITLEWVTISVSNA